MADTPEKPTTGFASSEFAASLGTALASVVAVFVALGKVSAADGASLTANITTGIVALGGLIAAAASVWKYVSGRVAVKEAHVVAVAQIETAKVNGGKA